jgi:hypothetical protein
MTDADLKELRELEEAFLAGSSDAGVALFARMRACRHALLARAEAFARIREALADGKNCLALARIIDEAEAKEREHG